jgi:hypothetical protein
MHADDENTARALGAAARPTACGCSDPAARTRTVQSRFGYIPLAADVDAERRFSDVRSGRTGSRSP